MVERNHIVAQRRSSLESYNQSPNKSSCDNTSRSIRRGTSDSTVTIPKRKGWAAETNQNQTMNMNMRMNRNMSIRTGVNKTKSKRMISYLNLEEDSVDSNNNESTRVAVMTTKCKDKKQSKKKRSKSHDKTSVSTISTSLSTMILAASAVFDKDDDDDDDEKEDKNVSLSSLSGSSRTLMKKARSHRRDSIELIKVPMFIAKQRSCYNDTSSISLSDVESDDDADVDIDVEAEAEEEEPLKGKDYDHYSNYRTQHRNYNPYVGGMTSTSMSISSITDRKDKRIIPSCMKSTTRRSSNCIRVQLPSSLFVTQR